MISSSTQRGGKVPVSGLRSTVADDHIAIGRPVVGAEGASQTGPRGLGALLKKVRCPMSASPISRHSQPIFLRALVAISRVVKFSRVAHPRAALVAKRPTIRR
jgi:hypothetical protein